jgi:tetratricopeptide (TPR) repeat protein
MQAVDSFRKAIALDGAKALYHSNLGLALLKLGDFDGADRRFDDAIAADKDYVLAYLNKGAVYAERAERKRALALRIESAVRGYRALGEKEKAEEALKEHAKVTDGIPRDEELAIDIFRRAISMDKERRLWSAHASVGRIYLQRGDFVNALGPLENARDLQRSDLGVRRDLALAYFGLDQYYRAFKEIQAIEQLGGRVDPDFRKKIEDKVKGMDESPIEQRTRGGAEDVR